MFIKRGGGIINRKLLLSIILLLGLTLVLNSNNAIAANLTGNIAPKVTVANPADHSIILKSQTIKVYFNEPVKAGSMSILLKNSAGKVIKTRNSISSKTVTIYPLTALTTGFKYYITFNTGSVKSLTGINNSKYSSSFTVSPLTLAQMKSGISRAQQFYNTHQRLPKYVSYGSKKIPIATFQKIIATQGLKIKTNTPIPF
ncbi:MAG: Ig-like domain-containing protein [Methanobacterium sp.]|nr:Ig-like domain-containing protein [Methanobacterium sp.]